MSLPEISHAPIEICYSASTRELDIRLPGEPAISQLTAALKAGSGTIEADTRVDPAPYEQLLTILVVEEHAGQRATLVPDATGRLLITGDRKFLDILSRNIDGLRDVAGDYHIHIEYFPDHPYLAEGSVAAVCHR